jgi:hypothetical protein
MLHVVGCTLYTYHNFNYVDQSSDFKFSNKALHHQLSNVHLFDFVPLATIFSVRNRIPYLHDSSSCVNYIQTVSVFVGPGFHLQ